MGIQEDIIGIKGSLLMRRARKPAPFAQAAERVVRFCCSCCTSLPRMHAPLFIMDLCTVAGCDTLHRAAKVLLLMQHALLFYTQHAAVVELQAFIDEHKRDYVSSGNPTCMVLQSEDQDWLMSTACLCTQQL